MTLQPGETTVSRPRFDISVPGQVPIVDEGEDGQGERQVHGMSPRPRDDQPREGTIVIGQQHVQAMVEKPWNSWDAPRPSELRVPEKDHQRVSSKLSGRTSDSANDLDKVLRDEVALVTSWEDDVRMYCKLLCEDWRFQICTTVLTVFALIGDDTRLLLTSREADNFFNILIVMAFLIFSTEIIAASLGVRGYFHSFFFYLDLIATSTMLLDLTWFGNVLYCKDVSDLRPVSQSGFETFLSNLTDTRASRAVRILRLVRLGKLYKFYQRSADHSRSEPLYGVPPGNPLESQHSNHTQDWETASDVVKPENGTEEDQEGAQEETRVGKKLSDMTSRRVIVLILVMLFCSFFFSIESYGKEFVLSGALGPNLIYERFRSWCPTATVTPWCLEPSSAEQSQPTRQEQRAWYEQYLQGFIRSHLSGPFAWRLYWVGLGSTTFVTNNASVSTEFLGTLAQLNQQQWLGASLPQDELWRWDLQEFGDAKPIPHEVKERLVNPWREQCLGFVGVPLYSDSAAYSMSTACSITDQLRCNEVHYEMPMLQTRTEADNVNLLFAFDTRPITRSEAGLSMLQTLFICIALAVGAISFSRDADHLLLGPLERILVKLEAIRKNPLHAMKLGDIEYREHELEEEENADKRWCFCCRKQRKNEELETLETAILERTLIKLGGLLALGFGEAGAEIIVHNMQGGTSAELNAMVPGQEVEAVFGFCSIRNFGDATDVLKEKVMVFVNQVSEIVHGICDTYHGSPNKIIGGNSFLVVWRMRGRDPELREKIADMAIMSFVCITIEVQKSNTLSVYRYHPGLQQRFPNFRVTLGFGLHCGWAIEGAIGSEYKIDASYLSPNVNVASQLEAASGQLGLWILLSNYMVKLCSKELLPYFRMIDNVMLEGSKKTLRLYTLDLDHSRVNVKPKLRGKKTKVYNRYKVRQMRETVKSELWTADFDIMDVLSGHSDFVEMREPYSKEFFERFAVGVRNYEAGEWLVARDLFITCHYSEELCKGNSEPGVWPIDGPVRSLLEFMEKHDYESPADWPGYRHLIPGAA